MSVKKSVKAEDHSFSTFVKLRSFVPAGRKSGGKKCWLFGKFCKRTK